MSTLLVSALVSLTVFAGGAYDPMPGIFRTKEDAANMDCRRLPEAEAHKQYPGRIAEPPTRTIAGTTRDVLVCKRRFIRLGERLDRDEAILTDLRETTGDIVQAALEQSSVNSSADSREPKTKNAETLTWYVDAFYPSMEVAAKIAVAARTELAERGQRVSDRVPLLAAGDIVVLSRLRPKDSYATACKRYYAEGMLTANDAFLGLMIVDSRETQLHAGVCAKGEWTWFR